MLAWRVTKTGECTGSWNVKSLKIKSSLFAIFDDCKRYNLIYFLLKEKYIVMSESFKPRDDKKNLCWELEETWNHQLTEIIERMTLSLRYFKAAGTAESLVNPASNNWTECNQQRGKHFITRTEGIQLITASSITVSKRLTKQLIYEWQQFQCSDQHQTLIYKV